MRYEDFFYFMGGEESHVRGGMAAQTSHGWGYYIVHQSSSPQRLKPVPLDTLLRPGWVARIERINRAD
jgi:hypothetical protein